MHQQIGRARGLRFQDIRTKVPSTLYLRPNGVLANFIVSSLGLGPPVVLAKCQLSHR